MFSETIVLDSEEHVSSAEEHDTYLQPKKVIPLPDFSLGAWKFYVVHLDLNEVSLVKLKSLEDLPLKAHSFLCCLIRYDLSDPVDDAPV